MRKANHPIIEIDNHRIVLFNKLTMLMQVSSTVVMSLLYVSKVLKKEVSIPNNLNRNSSHNSRTKIKGNRLI